MISTQFTFGLILGVTLVMTLLYRLYRTEYWPINIHFDELGPYIQFGYPNVRRPKLPKFPKLPRIHMGVPEVPEASLSLPDIHAVSEEEDVLEEVLEEDVLEEESEQKETNSKYKHGHPHSHKRMHKIDNQNVGIHAPTGMYRPEGTYMKSGMYRPEGTYATTNMYNPSTYMATDMHEPSGTYKTNTYLSGDVDNIAGTDDPVLTVYPNESHQHPLRYHRTSDVIVSLDPYNPIPNMDYHNKPSHHNTHSHSHYHPHGSKVHQKKVRHVLPHVPFIEIEKTMCFGTCPVYKATIFKDGQVSYDGKAYVKKVGKHNFRLSNDAMDNIHNEINKVNFFKLKDEYDEMITDVPTTIITVHKGLKKKRVFARANVPHKLQNIIKNIHDTLFRKMDFLN